MEENFNKKNIVFDVFLFFNELDLLDLRFRTLYQVVDFFIVTECTETFSGKPKKMNFAENRSRYREFEDKIIYNPISKADLEVLRGFEWAKYTTDLNRILAYKHGGRPAKLLHPSVVREISHRDAAILALSKVARPNDLILLSDVDEIPNPQAISQLALRHIHVPQYFKMKWYIYWVNNYINSPWVGTVAFRYGMLENFSLDMMRYGSSDLINIPGPSIDNGGWHFSYLGGSDAIATKLDALAYQGIRAEISKFLSRFRRRKWESLIERNADLLMQQRPMRLVPLDDSFPADIYEIPAFIGKYAKI